jgi:hypothetical protein
MWRRENISIESMNAEPQIVPVKSTTNSLLCTGRVRSAARVAVVVVNLISILLISG